MGEPGPRARLAEDRGPVPTGAGQGKPELTEAYRAEGIPEGQTFPPERRGRVDLEHWSSEGPGFAQISHHTVLDSVPS